MKHTMFTLNAAAAKLVEAYKKAITHYQTIMPLALSISADAPSDYSALQSDAASGKLAVTEAFSETAIYGKAGNVTFRIFHDYGHLIYKKEFTTSQEVELALMQWNDIAGHIEGEWRTVCYKVYIADTVEQSRHESIHGEFPKDQKAFVAKILKNGLR